MTEKELRRFYIIKHYLYWLIEVKKIEITKTNILDEKLISEYLDIDYNEILEREKVVEELEDMKNYEEKNDY